MRRKFRKRAAWLCFLTMLITVFCPFQALAVEEVKTGVMMYNTAGRYGYYSCNLQTGEKTYVPASEYIDDSHSNKSSEPRRIPPKAADPNTLDDELTEYYENDLFPEEIVANPEYTSGSDVEPYVVIPPDGRTAVGSTSSSRYSSTCLIVVRYEDGTKDYCTGFVIDDYYVLTVGHLAKQLYTGTEADHFAVYAGTNNGTYKKYSLVNEYRIGAYYADHCMTQVDYFQNGMYDDWAILKCESSMASVGYMGIEEVNSRNDMLGKFYYTQGYPLDKNKAEFGYNDNTELIKYRMYCQLGQVEQLGPETPPVGYGEVAFVNFDTYQGQSGSPVYRISGSSYYVNAMLVAEDTGRYYNIALLMNGPLLDLI